MTERPTTGSEKLRRRRKEKSTGHVLPRRSTRRQVSKKISQNKPKPVVAAEIDRVLRFASGASWKPDPRLRGRVWAHDPVIAAWAVVQITGNGAGGRSDWAHRVVRGSAGRLVRGTPLYSAVVNGELVLNCNVLCSEFAVQLNSRTI